MPLTLLVPDLLPPADAPEALRGLRLGALEKWLARADVSRAAARGGDAWLAAEHAIAGPVPHAGIALAGDGGPREGTWMHADPVHLRIDRDAVALHDAAVLDIGAHEATDLVAALQELFRPDGFAFTAPDPSRWYVRIPASEAPRTTPLAEAVGRNIFGLLPQGDGTINWRTAITEAQMVLSNHAVNAAREGSGKPAINSVWIWGAGEAPASLPKRFTRIHSDEPFARGLGLLAGSEVRPVPASLAALPEPGGDILVVLDALTRPLRAANVALWCEVARDLDRHWFEGLGRAAARHGGVRLVLPLEESVVVATLAPGARWRLFAKRRPWASHA